MSGKKFRSKSLGVEKAYQIYLPPDYERAPEKRFPVLYLLHGLGGNETNWRDLGIAEAAVQTGFPGIVVMPDGDDSFYVNWPAATSLEACLRGEKLFRREFPLSRYCVAKGDYESYLTDDLIAHVDSSYRTLASKQGRAISGLSMGGFGALNAAFRHPELYAAVASHSGVDSLLYTGPYPYQEGKVTELKDAAAQIKRLGQFGVVFAQAFGEETANWRAHDPPSLVQSLDPSALAIYLDCGTEDGFRLDNGMLHLSKVLSERGIKHDVHHIQGGRHDADFWRERIDDSLRFVAKAWAAGSASN